MTSALVVTQSLLAEYALGVKPVLSFEAHGKLDASFAAIPFGIPEMFGFGIRRQRGCSTEMRLWRPRW